MKKKNYVYLFLLIVVLSFTMFVPASAASKTALSKTRVQMYIGESQSLTVRNTKAKVRWSSSNTSVVQVNSCVL